MSVKAQVLVQWWRSVELVLLLELPPAPLQASAFQQVLRNRNARRQRTVERAQQAQLLRSKAPSETLVASPTSFANIPSVFGK